MQTSLSGFFIKQEIFRMIFSPAGSFLRTVSRLKRFLRTGRSEWNREATGKKLFFL